LVRRAGPRNSTYVLETVRKWKNFRGGASKEELSIWRAKHPDGFSRGHWVAEIQTA
jgi:Rps23 Pro-64 3,4-dihydroxylase Tpa1-like proline 4-hydroxylase